jgi:hypothetical protein
MAMTFRGLEFCHRNWILHRVSMPLFRSLNPVRTMTGSQTQQFTHRLGRPAQDC